MISKLENLCQLFHGYFFSSPKCHLEFQKLFEIVKTKGLKKIWNVKIRWISMLTHLKQIGKKFKMMIGRMVVGFGFNGSNQGQYFKFVWQCTIMGLLCILPMLETINVLMKFGKGKDYLYVITLQLQKFAKQTYIGCMMIQTHPSKIQTLMFIDVVVNTSCKITQDWIITNLNDGIKHLAFWIIR